MVVLSVYLPVDELYSATAARGSIALGISLLFTTSIETIWSASSKAASVDSLSPNSQSKHILLGTSSCTGTASLLRESFIIIDAFKTS